MWLSQDSSSFPRLISVGLEMAGSLLHGFSLTVRSRSTSFIFNSVADVVEWIFSHAHNISDLMHYLHDSITARPQIPVNV